MTRAPSNGPIWPKVVTRLQLIVHLIHANELSLCIKTNNKYRSVPDINQNENYIVLGRSWGEGSEITKSDNKLIKVMK